MRYKRTPSETGWFWIEDGFGEWWMAYLNVGSDPRQLTMFDPDDGVIRVLEVDAGGSWIDLRINRKCGTPAQWIGPIGCPGGDFGDHQVYFSAEDYDEAEETGKSLVMVHIEHGGRRHYTVTMVDVVPGDEARDVMNRAFPHDRESKPAADAVRLVESCEAEERGLVPPGQ